MQDATKRAVRGVMNLCEPTTVLPSQYGDSATHHGRPEMQLVAAILDDALHCIALYANTRSGRRRRDFLDAYHWVCKDQRDWPFAFSSVCDLLGLEPSAVRQFVQHLVETNVPGAARREAQPQDLQPDG
ncbi:MAG: hypothetical protein U0587_18350 [Candidatus Binatia bacterium]